MSNQHKGTKMYPSDFLYKIKQYFELENFQFCLYFHGVQHFRGPKWTSLYFSDIKVSRCTFWSPYKIFPVHRFQRVRTYWTWSIHFGPIWPKPALNTPETAQLRPQDVLKHVSTYDDMFTSWLSAVNATKKRAYWQSVLFPVFSASALCQPG